MTRSRIIVFALSILLFTQGCFFARAGTINSETQTIEATSTVNLLPPTVTNTPLPTPTLIPAVTEIPPTPIVSPVHIIAASGNLYIRRGPGTPYNRIGLLPKGTSAEVIGQDMLSKWVQIKIPESENTGWVSLLTPFTKLDGDLSIVPAFTFTEWPQPAYIKNCTEHDMLLGPGDIFIYNLYTNAQYLNEIQVDPGTYKIYDAFDPDNLVFIDSVDIREGDTYYAVVDGTGTHHNCP